MYRVAVKQRPATAAQIAIRKLLTERKNMPKVLGAKPAPCKKRPAARAKVKAIAKKLADEGDLPNNPEIKVDDDKVDDDKVDESSDELEPHYQCQICQRWFHRRDLNFIKYSEDFTQIICFEDYGGVSDDGDNAASG